MKPSRVFVVTAVGAFMAMLDLSIVNVAFPDLEASYPRASQASLSWVITAYVIAFGALLVTGGRTGDRVGHRRTFMTGLGVFVAASFCSGLAPNLTVLVASRVLQAAGAALLVPASLALLLAAYPRERRTEVVALWGGVGALAVAAGPSLGATIVSAGGWRWAFFVNVPIGAVVAAFGRRVLTESRADAATGRPDYLGVVLVTAAVGSLVLAISQGATWGWGDARIVGAFAAAAIIGARFVSRSRAQPEPVVDLSLFADRSFVTANLASLVYAAGCFAMLLCNILFLTGVWHYSIMAAGLAVTPSPLVVAAVSGSAGRLATRIGTPPVVLAGATCFAVAVMLLGTPTSVAERVTRSHHVWTYAAIAAALSGVIGAFIPRPSFTAVDASAGDVTTEPSVEPRQRVDLDALIPRRAAVARGRNDEGPANHRAQVIPTRIERNSAETTTPGAEG